MVLRHCLCRESPLIERDNGLKGLYGAAYSVVTIYFRDLSLLAIREAVFCEYKKKGDSVQPDTYFTTTLLPRSNADDIFESGSSSRLAIIRSTHS